MTDIRSAGSIGYTAIPVLETSRLRLRAYRLSDLDGLAKIWADPEVTRFIGGKPRSRPDVWQQIQRAVGGWAMLGYGYWAIEELASGRCVGELGFMEGLRDIEPSFVGTPEAGWVLEKASWGKGYISEALGAAFDWRDAHVPIDRTVCIIEPAHAASIRIAGKFGFAKLADTVIAGEPICVFERFA